LSPSARATDIADGFEPSSSPAEQDSLALDRETAEAYSRWFHALSDATRIIILSYLARQSEPVPVGTIVTDLQIGQSTVSHHLRTLLDVGFVRRQRDRTNQLYQVNRNCITRFPDAAEVVMAQRPRPRDSSLPPTEETG
jgi:DNA-binding transcriptional ArsR family regulator